MSIHGKVALVTGAGQGIGRAIALIDRRFAEISGAEIGATYKKRVESIPLDRAQTPEDVAAFVSYLAGPDSDYMTGQAPVIDGGLVYR
jgi:meso-butanediol dehydrogenase/(S,S)-butanediol dehydrogenase/diacetyl reductase